VGGICGDYVVSVGWRGIWITGGETWRVGDKRDTGQDTVYIEVGILNIRTILLPLKLAIMVGLLFSSDAGVFVQLAMVLFGMIVLPKAQSVVRLISYSGYMRDPEKQVYRVNEKFRNTAKAVGLQDVPIGKLMALSGDFPEWTG